MKSAEEIMNILDAYDLTGSFRDAAELAGCSHHTVARYVAERDAGRVGGGEVAARPQLIDEFLPKVEEWVEQSQGRIRADRAHDKLLALGYTGSDRTTRRAVAEVKAAYAAGRRRVHRPWVTEPGMWLQYDFGDGPLVEGVKTTLFVAWLAWSRFRIVFALRDKTVPSVVAALDRCFRLLGGAPTYVLTDNEKTVTVDHVAGVPVRNAQIVTFGRHYGVTVLTCQPADPASKGGVEASVKLAKADLVPTDTNLLDGYASFAELEVACAEFTTMINARVHRLTRRAPVEMRAEEQTRLHRVPDEPHTVAFGLARQVPVNTPMVTFEHGQYSVPQRLLGQQVWARAHGLGAGEQVVVVYVDPRQGPVEVARHLRAVPGSPRIDDDHFGGPIDKLPGEYRVRPRTQAEAAFLAIGDGAHVWLAEAAAAGTSRIRAKMEAAVTMAKVAGNTRVDWALGHAAVNGRFGYRDLSSILNAHPTTPRQRASETRSLAQGTNAWAKITTNTGTTAVEVTTSGVAAPDTAPEADNGEAPGDGSVVKR
jgi:transposase